MSNQKLIVLPYREKVQTVSGQLVKHKVQTASRQLPKFLDEPNETLTA